MFKLKYIGWFFSFLWICIKDLLCDPLDCFNEVALLKENYEDFKLRIALDNDEEFQAMMRQIKKEHKNKENETNN